MGCCGKKVKIVAPNAKVSIESRKFIKYSSAVKSNRVPPGAVLRECTLCHTKTITKVCPVCNIPLLTEKK